jgi:hypothetical protein
MQFLMGLNDSYKAIRGKILLLNPLLDVRQTYSSIVQEEKQRSLGDTHETTETATITVQQVELTALAVLSGQGASSCSNSFNRKPLHCSYCDNDHHVRDTCWKLHGYPPDHPKHKANRFKAKAVVLITTSLPSLQPITSRKVPQARDAIGDEWIL